MEKEQKITWICGPATGFYIDFENQEMGYMGNEVHLNPTQTRVLSVMAASPNGFTTDKEIKAIPGFSSVSLSRYYSVINTLIQSLWKSAGMEEYSDLLTNEIIKKDNNHGNTGYGLQLANTDDLDYLKGEILDSYEDPKHFAELKDFYAKTFDIFSSPKSFTRGIRRYFNLNWFPLFVYLFLILGAVLLLDSFHISVKALLIKIINIPFEYTTLFIVVLSLLPILCGLLIDVPVALKKIEKERGKKRSNLNEALIRKITMYIVPRFDSSKNHVLFFLVCNFTGAITTVSVLQYFKSIPGIMDYISVSGRDYVFAIIIAAGCLVALFSNLCLQTNYSPSRCADNYILTRAHAFMNLVYLSVILSFAGSLIYAFLSYRFFGNGGEAFITRTYIAMELQAYCYLWFSSDSPFARKIDSISKNNFITGLPFAAVFSTAYTILCYKPEPVCVIALLTAPAILLLWFFCFLKRKKENTIKLYYFVSSFFSILAITVIVMLTLSFRL